MNDLDEASAYLVLDMWDEAILALDALPQEISLSPPALRIRMCAAAATGRWEMAEAMAEVLRHGPDPYRFEAACCFQSLAAEHFQHGRLVEARTMVTAAIDTNPEHRALILDDPRFPADFI